MFPRQQRPTTLISTNADEDDIRSSGMHVWRHVTYVYFDVFVINPYSWS